MRDAPFNLLPLFLFFVVCGFVTISASNSNANDLMKLPREDVMTSNVLLLFINLRLALHQIILLLLLLGNYGLAFEIHGMLILLLFSFEQSNWVFRNDEFCIVNIKTLSICLNLPVNYIVETVPYERKDWLVSFQEEDLLHFWHTLTLELGLDQRCDVTTYPDAIFWLVF